MQLQGEASALEEAISAIDAQMNAKLPTPPNASPATKNPLDGSGKRKKAKGENLRVLQGYLAQLKPKGATLTEISANTAIGVSSVQAVFKRHAALFAKGNDDLWRAK